MKLTNNPIPVCERHPQVSADRAAQILTHLRGVSRRKLPAVVAICTRAEAPATEAALVKELVGIAPPTPSASPRRRKPASPPKPSAVAKAAAAPAAE